MRIAYYEAEYLDECAQLLRKVYNNEHWGCHWSELKSKKYIEELTQVPRFIGFLLINDDEELIGAALCHERTWWYKDELFIDEFFIDPECQQKGYGSKLLKYMTKYSKEQKLSGLTLMTNNLIVADFYNKNKFHDHEIYFMYKGIENIAE